MRTLDVILFAAALLCFILAASARGPLGRVNWIAVGLALVAFDWLVHALRALR